MTDTILLCAATRWEALPLARAWRLEAWRGGLYRGRAGHKNVLLLQTGMGAENAAHALERAAPHGMGLVLSVGLAGALQPGMRRGDLVLDLRGEDSEVLIAARDLAARLNIPLHFGRVANADFVLGPAAKRALGQKERAAAVDMESATLRTWAESRRLKFRVIRSILDDMNEQLPPAPQGEDAVSLAKYALANAARLPSLMSLGLRQGRAMAGLIQFLTPFLETL